MILTDIIKTDVSIYDISEVKDYIYYAINIMSPTLEEYNIESYRL
jgi:hypothetical protein